MLRSRCCNKLATTELCEPPAFSTIVARLELCVSGTQTGALCGFSDELLETSAGKTAVIIAVDRFPYASSRVVRPDKMLQKNAQQRRLKEVRRMLSKTSVLERPPLHGFDPLLSCREELHVELFSTSVLWHRVHTDFGESGCFVKTLNGPVTIIPASVN